MLLGGKHDALAIDKVLFKINAKSSFIKSGEIALSLNVFRYKVVDMVVGLH